MLGITEQSGWQFARLGILAEFKVFDCLKLSAEVAWLPYEQLSAQDTHWLRLGRSLSQLSGPIPENGGGTGVQIEAIMSYQVSDTVTFGLGGRYWHLETSGNSHFEAVEVNGGPQPVDWKSDIYGVFLQGSYKFGPYPYGSTLF